MMTILFASLFSGSLVLGDSVPSGKAEIVIAEAHGAYDCSGKVVSKFQVDQDTCYGLSAVPSSVVNIDQKVHCLDNGDFEVTTYQSSDGSCTGTSLYPTNKYKKGFCIISQTQSGPVTVKCPEAKKQNIVELAESVKDLSTLVSAVVAGDLVDTLSSPGPFTVFAPTNEGFAALPAATLNSLMKPENKAQLVDILTYHVLPTEAFSQDLALFQEVETVEGKKLHVQKWGGGVKVGASLKSQDLKTVTSADNAANNGVVHIIDGVLLPPQSAIVV